MEHIYIADCPRYDSRAIETIIRTAAKAFGVVLPQDRQVLLHPACPWAHPRFAPHAFTDAAVVQGAALALAGNSLTIATNSLPGFPTRYSYRHARYGELARRLPAKLVALDEASTQTVKLPPGSVVDTQVALPRLALKSGFTAALPKLTGSTYVSFAGAIRHHQSLLQDDAQLRSHHRLHTKMVDLIGAAPPDLIVVDAISATHKGGELSGLPVELGALIVGTNPVAVDTICALAYGLDPAEVLYLQLAAERGCGPADPAQIQISGDLTLDALRERSRQLEHIDPHPEHYPLPKQVQVLRSEKSGLAGAAGGLTEVFFILEHAGCKLSKARESVIVIGQVDKAPKPRSDEAAIIFLDDTSVAEYEGYSRIIRLPGRDVPLSTLFFDVSYAIKVATPRSELGSAIMTDDLLSKLARLTSRLA